MPDVAAARARRPLGSRPVFGVYVVVVAMLLAAWLSLTGLDLHLFWDDEANTGLYARNLLKTGRLTSWDGTNLVGYAFGGSLGEDLGGELRVPPLPAYVAAAGMALAGDTTVGGRFPFAVAGILSVGLLAVWLRRHLGRRSAWYLPSLILALSPAYLLYVRNCRYYALGVTFSLLVWIFWAPGSSRRCAPRGPLFDRRSLWRYAGAVVATVLLLSTHYLNAAAVLVTLPLFLLDRRYRQPKQYVLLGMIYAAALLYGCWVLATANPFATEYHVADDPALAALRHPDRWTHFTMNLWWFLRDLGTHEFFPWCLVAVLPVAWLPLPWLRARTVRLRPLAWRGCVLVAIVLVYLVVAAALTPSDMGQGPTAEMRYVVPLIALGSATAGLTVIILGRLAWPLAPLALLVLVASNTFQLGFLAHRFDDQRPWGSTLWRYVHSITHDYRTGDEAMVDLLERLPPGTTVRVWPTLMTYPPMLYVPDLHYCDQLTERKKIRDGLKSKLPDYLYIERARPEVILVPVPLVDQALDDPRLNYRDDAYEVVKTLSPYWRYTTKPEIPTHFFYAPPKDWRRFPGIAVLVRSGSPLADHPALAIDKTDADAFYQLGLAAKQAGETDAAAGYLAKALQIDPNHSAAHYYSGLMRMDHALLMRKEGNMPAFREAMGQAVEHFQAAMRIDSKDINAQMALANALQLLHRTEEAGDYYRNAVEVRPDLAVTHFNLANFLFTQGATGEAMHHYQIALDIEPDYHKAHVNLGIILSGQGRFDEAVGHFRAALDIEPRMVLAHLNLGLALVDAGQRQEGIDAIRKALELSPPESPAVEKIREKLRELGAEP